MESALSRTAIRDERPTLVSADRLRSHGIPVMVYLVDETLRILAVFGTGRHDASYRLLATRWSSQIEPLARRLIDEADDGAECVGQLSPENHVRVFSVKGSFSGYAVFVERQGHALSVRAKCTQYGFSLRESDVFELIIAGKRIREIAGELGIAAATVQCHIRNAGSKLGCTKRSAMIAKMLLG